MFTVLREMVQLAEAKNHMGEKEYRSYSSWKAACKKVAPDVWFDGDQDIGQAMVGIKPFKKGDTKSIGEWDGEKGTVFGDRSFWANEALGGPWTKKYPRVAGPLSTDFKAEYAQVLAKYGFKKGPNSKFHKSAGWGEIEITKQGHWEHMGVGDSDNDRDFEGTTSVTLDKHLSNIGAGVAR